MKPRNNKLRLVGSTLINLIPGELFFYLFMVNLDGRGRNCNPLGDLSDRSRVTDKTKDVNVKVFDRTNVLRK